MMSVATTPACLAVVAASLIVGGIASGAGAATFTPSFSINGGTGNCVLSPTGTATAKSDSCDEPTGFASYEAYSTGGKLGVGTVARVPDGSLPTFPGDSSVVVAVGAAYTDEIEVTSGPASGFLEIDLRIDGSGTLAFAGSTGPGGDAYNTVSWFIQGSPIPAFETDAVTYGGDFALDRLVTATLPYAGGALSVFVSLEATSVCAKTGIACEAVTDLLGSATVVGGRILDGAMQEVAGAAILSGSGFDYLGATDAVTVPLPAPGLMLLSGLAAIAAVRRRVRG